jgi:DNA topoisomerase-1
VKSGRFGPYVEMRAAEEASAEPKKVEISKRTGKPKRVKKKKPIEARRSSIPAGVEPSSVTIEMATKYLSIPRETGAHPDTGMPITAGTGRFGPFIVHNGDFRSLKGADSPYDITHERALEILKEPKKGRPGVAIVREVGEHPKTKKKIYLYKSKSGFFLKKGFKHFFVVPDKADTLTAAEAAELLKGR